MLIADLRTTFGYVYPNNKKTLQFVERLYNLKGKHKMITTRTYFPSNGTVYYNDGQSIWIVVRDADQEAIVQLSINQVFEIVTSIPVGSFTVNNEEIDSIHLNGNTINISISKPEDTAKEIKQLKARHNDMVDKLKALKLIKEKDGNLYWIDEGIPVGYDF